MDVLEDALKNNTSMCIRTVPDAELNENISSAHFPSNLARPLSCKSSRLMNNTPYGWYPTAKGQQFKAPNYKTFANYDEELSFLQQHGLLSASSVRQKLKEGSHLSTRPDSRLGAASPSVKPASDSTIQEDNYPDGLVNDQGRLVSRPKVGPTSIHCCANDAWISVKNEWKPIYPTPTWSEDGELIRHSSNEVNHSITSPTVLKDSSSPKKQRPQTVPATFKGVRMSINQSNESSGDDGGSLSVEGNKYVICSKRRPATAQVKSAKSKVSSSMQMALQATELTNNGSLSREHEKENSNKMACLSEGYNEANLIEDSYDKALNHYGWRMEIPNDPLNLKETFLAKRLSYTVQVPVPKILKQPPRMFRMNAETFFHQTIPNQKLSFDISPDFVSERYSRARSALQKKGLWNYSYKNFSFIY